LFSLLGVWGFEAHPGFGFSSRIIGAACPGSPSPKFFGVDSPAQFLLRPKHPFLAKPTSPNSWKRFGEGFFSWCFVFFRFFFAKVVFFCFLFSFFFFVFGDIISQFSFLSTNFFYGQFSMGRGFVGGVRGRGGWFFPFSAPCTREGCFLPGRDGWWGFSRHIPLVPGGDFSYIVFCGWGCLGFSSFFFLKNSFFTPDLSPP